MKAGPASAYSLVLSSAVLLGLAPGTTGRIQFEDRQPASGIAFVLDNGTTPDKPVVDAVLGGVALLDFDNDGLLDVFFTNGARIPGLAKDDPRFWNRPYRNQGDGTFGDVTERAGVRGEGYSMGAAVADFDNDGWSDLYVTGVNRNVLYHNERGERFTDVTERAGVGGTSAAGRKLWSVGAAWLDYDNDGDLDLFIGNESSDECPAPSQLFRNDGGKFVDVAAAAGVTNDRYAKGATWGDYDGDRYLDLYVSNNGQPNRLYHNKGDGTFDEVAAQFGPVLTDERVSRGLAVGDLDNDGRLDVVVNDLDGKPQVLHNELADHGHWLLVQLQGKAPNTDAIGAVVTLKAGPLSLMRLVQSGTGYISQDDKRQHFGLGAQTQADSLEVLWPDGTKTRLENVKADQVLKVEQGR
jgi:hypothetical protein